MFEHPPFRRALRRLPAAGLLALLLPLASVTGSRAAAPLPPVGWSRGTALPASFSTKWDMASAYFPPSDQVVLFGGAPRELGDTWSNDTWTFSAGVWTKRPSPPVGLTPRGGAAMAYDPDIGKVVLFGGQTVNWPPQNDTWLWDGTSWTPGPAAPTSLTGRSGGEMVYDPDIHRLVYFGGSGVLPYTDTWLFDGTSWSQGPAAPAAMSPRVYFGMTHDPVMHKVVLVGGNGALDTWLFDGAAWTAGPALPATVGPKERISMAYDPQLEGEVFFGGLGPGPAGANFWLFRKGVWIDVPAASPTAPDARFEVPILFHPIQDAVMLIGGINSTDKGTTMDQDVWFFREVAPKVASVKIAPVTATAPVAGQRMDLTTGALTGGYKTWTYTYRWYINGVEVPGVTGKALKSPDTKLGDTVQAKVRLTDWFGISGPWVSSNVATVKDRSVRISPTSGKVGTVVTVETGPGWSPGSTLHVKFTNTTLKNVTADSSGHIVTTITIPQHNPGTVSIKVSDDVLGETNSVPFTVTPG